MCATNNILYILGNGFDRAHNLPTNYEDFHTWLNNNGDKPFIHAFENLYPDVKNTKGEWRDMESALGNISLEHAIDIDVNYQYYPDEIRNEKSSLDAYRCGDKLSYVVKVLQSCFGDWTHSIDLSKCTKKYVLNGDSHFFSFNYTRTLEEVYIINSESIHHVHGTIGNNGQLVVGYGDAQFDDDDFEPDMVGIDKELILNILRENRKPVETIIQEQTFKRFMQSISSVSSVIVFGHSCSEVDKPYYVEIAKKIKENAHWTFYVHNKKNNNQVKRYADSVRKEYQSFEITNESPIELLK